MAFKKKTWVDRMVEYAGRRKITNVTTMAAQIVDVERAEGVVSEEGTAINAVNMNDFEQRTADAFSAVQQDIEGINSDLGGLHLTAEGSGAVTKYYAQLGADSASKKLLGNGIDLGTLNAITQQSTGSRNSVFDISTVFFDYKSITKENIVWMPVAYTNYPQGSTDCLSFQGISIVSYDSNTGRITIAGGSNRNYHWGFSFAKIRIIIVY